MTSGRKSLTRSLLCWLFIPTFAICVTSTAIVLYVSHDLVRRAFDLSLRDVATGIRDNLAFESGKLRIPLPPGAIRKFVAFLNEEILFQVVDAEGKIVRGDIQIPPPPNGIKANESFRDAMVAGRLYRVMTFRPDGDPERKTYIQVAQTYRARNSVIHATIAGIVLPELAVLLCLGFVTCVGIRRGLASLDAVVRIVNQRSARDLRPIKIESAPIEIDPLLHSFNGLLGQIENDMAVQRRFVENASHQLRTPLSGMKAQIELIQRENDGQTNDGLQRVITSLDRMTRLVYQLLGLVRSGKGFAGAAISRVDVEQLAEDVTADFAPLASSRKIDIGFEGAEEELTIEGDPAAIREMLANLIENAVQSTPADGRITISAKRELDIIVAVEDDGVGIPTDERKKVFERFYRIPRKNSHGSGLGLSIVEEIARAHGATIEVGEGRGGRGTKFSVRFPEASGSTNRS